MIPAPAEATPYTKADMDFVASVTAMGYRDDEKDRLIKTGHVVCELLDEGANSATVKAEVTIRYSTGKEQHDDGGYWPNLFIQIGRRSPTAPGSLPRIGTSDDRRADRGRRPGLAL